MPPDKAPVRPDDWVKRLPPYHSTESRRRLLQTLSPAMRKAAETFPLFR